MKRVLSILAILALAGGGLLAVAAPASAEDVATCTISDESVDIDTTANTASINYDIYCPVIVGYTAPATASCAGSGTGDQSSAILAWSETTDECDFTSGGSVIGVAHIDMTRQFALTPLTGLSAEVGTGLDVEGFLDNDVEASAEAGHFTFATVGSHTHLDITSVNTNGTLTFALPS
jgi:hypothetical protein